MVSGNTETNINVTYDNDNNKLHFAATNTEYTAGTGITISESNVISLSDPGQTATVTIQDTDGNNRTLVFKNGLLTSGLASGTTTGEVKFRGTDSTTTLTFTNGILTTQTTLSDSS